MPPPTRSPIPRYSFAFEKVRCRRLTPELLAAGGAVAAGLGSLRVWSRRGGGEHGLLAVAALLAAVLAGQRLREAEHRQRRAEEQGGAQEEARPPGADPARVFRADAQLVCERKRPGVTSAHTHTHVD